MDRHLDAKSALQDLINRDGLNNKSCVDCANPNPQWASVSFAIFLCLQCAGVHRGFGVHISFVRSVSMDTWQADQIKRMQLGGNTPFRQFLASYAPQDQSGYKQGLGAYDTYHCWAASQYRDKLDAALAERPWSPSPPPVDPPGRPSSAQGLRKSRAFARNLPPSPPSSATVTSPQHSTVDQKSANEAFFASLGQSNASRPTDLPPSQGGRYQGFGNTPQHPSFDLSSNSAPTLQDLQDNPGAALSKGWSLFSAAVSGASRVVTESVIQPGIERALDPNLHATVRGYISEAQRRAQLAGHSANEWSKTQLGVDVADQVGGVVGTVKDRFESGPQGSGYGPLAMHHEGDTSALYQDDTDDFFGEYSDAHTSSSVQLEPDTTKPPVKSKDEDWDEWKDF